jgi:Fe-S cluster assembly protein SufD
MTAATTDFYLANFAPFESEVAKNARAWTQPLRQAAITRFAELGFPTTRGAAWMHTHVVPITRIPFQPAHRAAPDVAPDALATAVPEFVGTELRVLNGHDVPELSACRCCPVEWKWAVSPSLCRDIRGGSRPT